MLTAQKKVVPYRKYAILLILALAAIPWLWYRPGYIIAKGDNFPYLFSPETIRKDLYLWSMNDMGNPTPSPAYVLFGLLWAVLRMLGTDIGAVQIILSSIQIGGAAASMIYLSRTVYPNQQSAGFFAAVFYVFNFFLMSNLLNAGLMWTYAFGPLLIALLVKTLAKAENTLRYSIVFAVSFAAISSLASMNPANNALILISLLSVVLFYTFIERKTTVRQVMGKLALLSIVTLLINMWWIIPVLNYYVPSSSMQLISEVNVSEWTWTHVRSSFLNIFWLNGAWGWRPEYYSFFNLYFNNPILITLLFAPFSIAVLSLLFKDKTRRQNAYFMLTILVFMFLAKGSHEPLGSLNLLLYEYIPFMDMFREPATKFTMIMIPFLALLIGYSISKIMGSTSWSRIKHGGFIVRILAGSVILVFIVSTLPILTNPIENMTTEIPYSAYVKVPEYWQEADKLLNNIPEDFKVLLSPLDDYYQVPYVWGYYGSDGFPERFFHKPVIGTVAVSSYLVNPGLVSLINQLRDSMKFNRTQEFETILGLLGVGYILQRNDLDYSYMASTGRDILEPEQIRQFLLKQPNIRLFKTVGLLDIYENTKTEPFIHCFEYGQAGNFNLRIENIPVSSWMWNFNTSEQIDEWKNATPSGQFGSICLLSSDNSQLKFEILNSTWGWKTIAFPLIPVQYDDNYDISLDIKAQDAHDVHIKVNEFDKNLAIAHSEYLSYVGDKTFDWKNVQLTYVPKKANVSYLGFAVWSGSETPEPLPNTIWMDNVSINGYVTRMNTYEIQNAFQSSIEDPPATIIDYQKIDQTEIIVRVNAFRPFNLMISEAFNTNWKAYSQGFKYDSFPVFSAFDGFMINQTGEFEIHLSYEPQKWFYAGSLLSAASIMFCIILLVYSSRKRIERLLSKHFWSVTSST